MYAIELYAIEEI